MRKRAGSMIVEAAIVLPIFIIASITLCWLMKASFLQTAVFHTAENQLRQDSIAIVSFTDSSIRDALEENNIDGEGYRRISKTGGITIRGVDDYECLKFAYDTKIRLPVPFVKEINLENELTYRKWKGFDYPGTAMGFEAMEQEEKGNPVIVFPHAGARSHGENCRYVRSYSQETVLTPAIRKKYDACRHCTEGDEYDGQKVYVFQYGSCYHEKECSSVTRYTIKMDENDAKSKGYDACSVCGGK